MSTMNKSLLQQIKKRRTQLGLKQVDMQSRTGISRQQYQKLESQGNPRLEILEIIAAELNAQLMLIPDDKVYLISLYTTNFIGSLSYQAFSFLKLLALS